MSAVLRPARAGEAAPLSELALRSKGHWGYDADFLEACRAELTWSDDDLARRTAVVAERDGELLGFFVLDGSGEAAELDALFVDPPAIGTGIGGRLMSEALRLAREQGRRTVGIDADPDAEPFYRRYGARRVGEVPSGSIPGRTLPRLEIDLSPASQQ